MIGASVWATTDRTGGTAERCRTPPASSSCSANSGRSDRSSAPSGRASCSHPAAVACFVAAIGNGGTLYRPQIVQSVQNAEGEVIQPSNPRPGHPADQPETLAAIRRPCRAWCGGAWLSNLEGTAYRRFLGLTVDGLARPAPPRPASRPARLVRRLHFRRPHGQTRHRWVVVMLEFQEKGRSGPRRSSAGW
jgi:hypothetical protein